MWCTWCFSQRTCGLVGVRRLSAVGYRLSAIGCPLSDVRCPMAAGTVFPKVDTPYGQALTGLRVDGPLGRRFLRGLSLTRLWREGCGERPYGRQYKCCLAAAGKTVQPPCGRGNAIPLWWLAPPPCPVGSMSLDSRVAELPYESSSFATPAVRWGGKRKAP